MKKLFSPRAFGRALNGLALCFALLPTIALAQFTDISAGLPGVEESSVAWGDFDNDGDLDILLTGLDAGSNRIAKVYRNTGSVFSDISAGLTGVFQSSVAWGDYDNDGDLDILLTGLGAAVNRIAKVYRNTGGIFSDISAGLTGVNNSSVAWGDYDNDGDLDILLTGQDTGVSRIAKVYQNNGGVFSDIGAGLTGVAGSSAWGDYDNDGDLDLLLTGDAGGSNRIAKVYQNTGSGFADIGAGLVGVFASSVAWGDYDNDGDLDILLTGDDAGGIVVNPIAKVYQNTGSGFTDIGAGLSGVRLGSVAWGDYDSDGDLDILLTGEDAGGNSIAKVYQNIGSGFTDIGAGLVGVTGSSVAWGDYDNDGDLDILLTGGAGGGSRIAKVYQNTGSVFNTAPAAPVNLSESITGNSVTFSWNASTDAQTPSAGLTYNLMVGATSNGVDINSPMAEVSNGYRRVAQLGGTNHNESWTLNNLCEGKYFWRVQAVDHAFAGSAFSAEGTFTIGTPLSANAGADQTINFGQSVQIGGSLTASGGTPPYSYSWSPNDGSLDDASAANPTASPTSTTTYTVTVTAACGFTATDEVTVEVIPVKPFVFVANKVTLKSTKQSTPSGDIHSNGLLTVEKGYPSTYNSNLTAIGKITINKQNTINGNVKSQTSVSNSGKINGTKTIGPVANESLPSLSYSAGGSNVTVPNGGSLSLAPGSYGIVTMSQGGKLMLTSGEYFMNELRYSSTIEGGVIEIDLSSGDPVTINVVTNLQFGHEAAIVLLPNGESDSELVTFNTLQSTNANWGREGYFLGSFNAPNAIVTLVKNSQLRGSICAKEILVSNDCLFLHHDSPGSLPGPGNLPKAFFVDEEEAAGDQSTVTSYQLEQNYPNPFNPTTVISFQLPVTSEVTLSIFNMSGQLVKQVASGKFASGNHNFTWDATNERGERVASGVYLYVIKAGEFTAQKKLVLMK